MADVTKINGYIIKDANAPHPSNAGSAGQILKKTETGTEWADASFKPAGKSYLTFSSPNSFTLKVNDTTKHWDGTLEYFSSNRTWTTWDGATTLSSVDNDGENVLYLRGTGNTVITGNSPNYRWILTGNDIACIGNIENLLDYATVEAGNHPIMANYCYYSMFYDCSSLAQAPALPATTLTESCYQYMFYGCTSLTQAPTLPATTLANGCCDSMFGGCTSLTQAPALPATTLASNCYLQMFYGCTSLTQAPALPATTLAVSCYQYMFYGCTGLTQAPTLPATTLTDSCYRSMFYGCTSLAQAPALPATTLAVGCYQYMFNGCTSLKLSATQTDEYTIKYRIPTSGTGTSATNALKDMFASTGGTFTGTPEINTAYYLSSDNIVVRETKIATLNGYVGSMIEGKVPDGGTTGQVLKKTETGTEWANESGGTQSATQTITLPAPAWAHDGSRYSMMVNVTGVTASTPVVLVDVALSGTDIDADAAALEAWGIVSANNVEQGNGRLTFYALSMPSVNIPVNVGVC